MVTWRDKQVGGGVKYMDRGGDTGEHTCVHITEVLVTALLYIHTKKLCFWNFKILFMEDHANSQNYHTHSYIKIFLIAAPSARILFLQIHIGFILSFYSCLCPNVTSFELLFLIIPSTYEPPLPCFFRNLYYILYALCLFFIYLLHSNIVFKRKEFCHTSITSATK